MVLTHWPKVCWVLFLCLGWSFFLDQAAEWRWLPLFFSTAHASPSSTHVAPSGLDVLWSGHAVLWLTVLWDLSVLASVASVLSCPQASCSIRLPYVHFWASHTPGCVSDFWVFLWLDPVFGAPHDRPFLLLWSHNYANVELAENSCNRIT